MTNYLNTCKTFDPFSPLDIENEENTQLGLRQMLEKISFYHHRSKQRQHLKTLEPRLLRDIGLTREQAEFEADKPFWKD